MSNLYDDLFGDDLEALDNAIKWDDKMSPFIKGEDLDFNDLELADSLYNYEFKAPEPKEEN